MVGPVVSALPVRGPGGKGSAARPSVVGPIVLPQGMQTGPSVQDAARPAHRLAGARPPSMLAKPSAGLRGGHPHGCEASGGQSRALGVISAV